MFSPGKLVFLAQVIVPRIFKRAYATSGNLVDKEKGKVNETEPAEFTNNARQGLVGRYIRQFANCQR